MSAGELALVAAAVLGVIVFAALVATLVRVRDMLAELRAEVAALRTEAVPLVEDLRRSAAEADSIVAGAHADLERFDRVIGSAEAVSAAVGRGSRVTRVALSAPVIKAAGLATGTSRAVRKLRTGT